MNHQPILLVEDDANDVELVVHSLKTTQQIVNAIDVVRDGVEAMAYLLRTGNYEKREDVHPLVIFLDIKIPKMDGIEVLRRVKTDSRLKMIPVVMLTASNAHTDMWKEQAYHYGVNAYVVKPVKFEAFAVAIRQLGMFWVVINEPPPL